MKFMSLVAPVSLLLVGSHAYVPGSFPTRRSDISMKRRGRGSFQSEMDVGGNKKNSPMSSGSMGGVGQNWVNTNKSVKELPTEEGTVSLLDTNAFLLKDRGTNPTGAVSVMKYESQTHCFSVNCPSCKIPLTKAQALPANEETGNAPRLSCDFCKSTFNLETGAPVTSQGSAGFFGGIAKAVLSSQESEPLPIYRLGEKNGKVLFSME